MSDLNQENTVEDGLKEMRQYYAEFCDKQKGSTAVRNFLVEAFNDDALLLRYLIGRKYRPKHAWDTLRSYAEVRFDKYPEMFPAVLPPKEYLFCENKPIFGILKERDSKGRRIAFFQLSGWDTDKCSLEELSILTFLLSKTSRGYQDLHERLSPSILPKCFGGNLETDEATDPQFF
ncbi:unnamed protein product [Orchesella dallaii]|uniref:CRAL/TRIO N-terminal domain-containing protein n=1 Tax=Orchesella dallaii TaxID=48710 RepID=A0ABP1R0N9_9HEXA